MLSKIKNSPFAKNSFILFFGMMTINVLNYVFHFMLGRMVSIETYGEAEALLSLFAIISIPGTTISTIATKYASHTKAERSPEKSLAIFKALNRKVLTFSIPFLLVSLAIIPLIKNFLNASSTSAIVILFIGMIFGFFSSVNSGFLNGWQKFKDASIVGILSNFLKIFLLYFAILFSYGINGIIGSLTLSVMIGYLLTFPALRFITSTPIKSIKIAISEKNLIKRYSLTALLGIVAIAIFTNVDMVIAKSNLSAEASGRYGAISIAAKIIFYALMIIASVLFSMSAEENHTKKDSGGLFKKAFFLTTIGSILMTVLYFAFSDVILQIMFGQKYLSMTPYLGWVALAVSLFSISHLFMQYFLSIDKKGAVYAFFILALLQTLLLSLFGKSITSIIALCAMIQIVNIITGSIFFLRKT